MEKSVPIVIPILLLCLPMILGACVFLFKIKKVVSWEESFNGWVANKRIANGEKTGFVSRWFFRPLLWGLAKIMTSTEQMQDEYVRSAVRTAAYVYILYFACMVAYISVAVVIAFVIIVLAFWVLSFFLDGGSSESYRTSTVNSRFKGKRLYNTQGIFNKEKGRVDEQGRVYDTTGIFDKQVGRVDEDGRIFDMKGVFDTQKGRIDSDGNIYDTTGVFDKRVARIDENGSIKDTSGIFDKEIGKAE